MGDVLIQMIIIILQICIMVFLLIKAYRHYTVLNEKGHINDKNISFKGIKDFFPKNIRRKLESDSSMEKSCIDEVVKACQNLLLTLGVYILSWILYLVMIVVRIVWLINGHYESYEPVVRGYVLGSVIMSILILYWFFLTPIFEKLNWKIPAELGYFLWEILQSMLNIIQERLNQIRRYIFEFIVSFLSVYGYIIAISKLLVFAQIKPTFWIILLILMFYQYMILKLFSKIIKTMIMFIIQKFYKLQCLEKYVRGEILYLILKNCTYLSMVFIYAALTYMDKSGTQLEVAIGVLFLLDTFFNQENVIQEKIKS